MKQSKKGENLNPPRSLLNYVPLKKFKTFFFRLTFILFFLFVNVSGANLIPDSYYLSNYNKWGKEKKKELEKETPEEAYIRSVKERIYEKLLSEVKDYMNSMAPDSKLDPEIVTKKCLEYDMDIVFVLAQGVLESNLGTKGKAAETNSVWNVGTYDNGVVKYTYRHPNESIDPYLQLLKDKYLINITSQGDTIYRDLHHLIQDKGYKNLKGQRYATAIGYENGMRKLIVGIDMKTSISFYQDLYKMSTEDVFAYFAPAEQVKLDYSLLSAMR